MKPPSQRPVTPEPEYIPNLTPHEAMLQRHRDDRDIRRLNHRARRFHILPQIPILLR